MKNKFTAAMLAIFLGTFWFHKFYLGKWIQGLLYILFCFTGIPTILWVLEWIVIISTNKPDFDIKYNYDYLKKQKELWYEEEVRVKVDLWPNKTQELEAMVWFIFIIIVVLIYLVFTY